MTLTTTLTTTLKKTTHARRTLAVLAVACGCLSSVGVAATQHHKRPAPPAITSVPQNLAPALPLVPAHEPAVAPQVTYENGQLLIDAKNSTLADVLRAVEKHTGASFDISAGDTSERVMGRLGPGPARDVLADLLNGSHFNYVMLSPPNDPSALSRVVLTPRGSAAPTNAPPEPQAFQNQQFQQPVQISPALQVQQQNAAADESADNGDTPDENADQAADQPEVTPGDTLQGDQQVPQQGVKTPEQLLQELRQQQQVIQQQQLPPGQVPPGNNQ